ncbi:MAG: hypothetical protein U0X73_08495 [Thermoanaerobaculia bacterium]
MDRRTLIRHAKSCGLLLIPAFAWNLALFDLLPPAFSKASFGQGIPAYLTTVENVARAVLFTLPFFMPLELATPVQRRGLALFTAGTLVYFASWLALIIWPSSVWSTSAAGFMAPAYTPLLWLSGLALVGRRLFWGHAYRWWYYLLIAALFLTAHIWHTAIVHARGLPASAFYGDPLVK